MENCIHCCDRSKVQSFDLCTKCLKVEIYKLKTKADMVDELTSVLQTTRDKMAELLQAHSACHPSLIPWKLADLDKVLKRLQEEYNRCR